MSNVVELKTGYQPLKDSSDFLAGCAAGVCDTWRQTGDMGSVYALRDSCMTYQDFVDAGVEEYDLETLREIFNDDK